MCAASQYILWWKLETPYHYLQFAQFGYVLHLSSTFSLQYLDICSPFITQKLIHNMVCNHILKYKIIKVQITICLCHVNCLAKSWGIICQLSQFTKLPESLNLIFELVSFQFMCLFLCKSGISILLNWQTILFPLFMFVIWCL